MHIVEPKVYLIAKPQFMTHEASQYLLSVGAERYVDRKEGKIIDDSSELIEFMGRLCYKSWEPGLNPNVTKIRESQSDYIRNIIESRHGAVVAHAQYSFVFSGISRVAIMEIQRHQIGAHSSDNGELLGQEGMSQESLRYVRLDDIGFWYDPCFDETDRIWIREAIMMAESTAQLLIEKYLRDTKLPFSRKKEITSAIRRILPMGISTELGWSANIRTIRHCIEQRTSRHAEKEIRLIYGQVGEIMRGCAPDAFNDYIVNEDGEWITDYTKV